MDPTAVALVIELLKIGIQYQITKARMEGLSEDEILKVLQTERDRFMKNIATPLPNV